MISMVGLSVTGCSSAVVVRGAESPTESTSPELIEEATDFADWSLPADGKVLLVRRDRPGDLKYSLAVEMSPTDLVWMLENSKFVAEFREWTGTSPEETIAGPPLDTSPHMRRGQDFFQSAEGVSMIRDVLVDERTPELRVVHLEFRGQ
ncbi:hypothetical protein [Nocardia lasii]|uniref:Lipoprotein n=1 Tax=Nocardia lasii TaxID=1616107 RepID=A0ABW1JWQ4_9NOCA